MKFTHRSTVFNVYPLLLPLLLCLSPGTCLRAQSPASDGQLEVRESARVRPLRVAEGGTHLAYEDTEAPFFYLGDTAWELLHRCDRAEVRHYLTTRAEQGFNVIQTVLLAELEGLTDPNPYGHLPLENQDPTRPVEAYFEHVDFAVHLADSLGIYLGLLPTWGDKFNKKWGVGPEIFTPENARIYGEFLGRRYRNHNVIWILGGDRNPEPEDPEFFEGTEYTEDYAIVDAMGRGLDATCAGQLITYHPQGGYGSYQFFHSEVNTWLDFHLFQTGHGTRNDKHNYDFPREGNKTDEHAPVINGEPCYEDHPINWRPANGWFDAYDTRQAAWWSVLAGADGHVFGNHNIWQMWQPGRKAISAARTPWREALRYPAAPQMAHVKNLLLQFPYYEMVTDFDYFIQAPNSGGNEVVTLRTDEGERVLAYVPHGHTLDVLTAKLPDTFTAKWYDPRTGSSFVFTPERTAGRWRFDPPGEVGRGNDWVLVVTP